MYPNAQKTMVTDGFMPVIPNRADGWRSMGLANEPNGFKATDDALPYGEPKIGTEWGHKPNLKIWHNTVTQRAPNAIYGLIGSSRDYAQTLFSAAAEFDTPVAMGDPVPTEIREVIEGRILDGVKEMIVPDNTYFYFWNSTQHCLSNSGAAVLLALTGGDLAGSPWTTNHMGATGAFLPGSDDQTPVGFIQRLVKRDGTLTDMLDADMASVVYDTDACRRYKPAVCSKMAMCEGVCAQMVVPDSKSTAVGTTTMVSLVVMSLMWA